MTDILTERIGKSAEVVMHAGNNRACVFGLLQKYGSFWMVKSHPSEGTSIKFDAETILKVDMNDKHIIIYI